MHTAFSSTVFNDPVVDSSTALAEVATAPEVVAQLVSAICPPAEPLELLRFTTMADDLSRLDGHAAAALLDQPFDRFGGAYMQLTAYALAAMTEQACARHGLLLTGREHLLRTIRQQIRFELVRIPVFLSALWLLPATAADRTSAYVGSLMLTRSGEVARPWLWDGIPSHGRFRIISPQAGAHPAADHHRCDGLIDLAYLAGSRSSAGAAHHEPA